MSAILQWFLGQLLARWPVVVIFFGPVLIYFFVTFWRVRKETKECLRWAELKKKRTQKSVSPFDHGLLEASLKSEADKSSPSGSHVDSSKDAAPNAYITDQLGVFLDEAERWRIQGIVVPMTDYSDRIDSLIEGFVDRLHNAVNLFLVAGLAGTFFGMAEFARQASVLQQVPDSRDILEALRTALGHSFPIGFLGLTLTILFHPFASYWERRLREASTSAVNQALHFRTASLKQDSFEGLALAMRELPQEMAKALMPANQNLITQLQPLVDLPKAIQKNNQEFLDPLRELFAQSRKEWKETVGKLDRQSERVSSAIATLEQPIQRLTAKIDDIGALISAMANVTEKVLGDAQRITATTEQLHASVEGTAKALDESAAKLSSLPEAVRTDMSNLHEVLRDRIGSYYELLGERYVNEIRELAASSAGNIAESATKGSLKLQEAAQSLQNMAESVTPQLKGAMEEGAKRLQVYLEQFDTAFRQHFPQAVADLQTNLIRASAQIEAARAVLEGMTAAGTLAAEHAQQWSKVEKSLQELGTVLHAEIVQFERSATVLQESGQTQTKASQSLDRSITALDRSVSTLEFSVKGMRIPQSRAPKPSLWKSVKLRAQHLFRKST